MKTISNFSKFICILLLLISTSCKTFHTKADYYKSEQYLETGRIDFAIKTLPRKEGKNFITIMEKTYLNLLQGKAEIYDLAKLARKIDNQVKYKISRGIKSFFYLETPDGYFASEHEIIWMHLLLSWGYSLQNDFEKARVEVKKASILIGGKFSSKKHFDDPFLRILLATMWAMCGEWEEAQVDFRKAAKLKPSLWWAKRIGNLEKQPKLLLVVLRGIGPEPIWKDRSIADRKVSFRQRTRKKLLKIKDKNNRSIRLYASTNSSYWYKRHFERNNVIADLIEDSKYVQKNVAASAVATASIGVGVVIGTAIATGGLAAGGAIIYLGLAAESGEAIGLGVLVAIGGVKLGIDTSKNITRKSLRRRRELIDPSDKYRFVRFLPEYSLISFLTKSYEFPFRIQNKETQIIENNNKDKTNINQVIILYSPE